MKKLWSFAACASLFLLLTASECRQDAAEFIGPTAPPPMEEPPPDPEPEPEPDPEPEPEAVVVSVSGRCAAEVAHIQCRDTSTSRPADRIELVQFEPINNVTGLSRGLQEAPVNAVGNSGVVDWFGVPAGNYTVQHFAYPDDGGTPATTSHPVTVP